MLAAPQAETLVTDFAFRWLDLLEVNKFEWDKQIFPEFSVELRQDVATEIDLFLRSILLEDKNVEQLLTAESRIRVGPFTSAGGSALAGDGSAARPAACSDPSPHSAAAALAACR